MKQKRGDGKSQNARERISGEVERAEAGGAKVTYDGRANVAAEAPDWGYYNGQSIIEYATTHHEAA